MAHVSRRFEEKEEKKKKLERTGTAEMRMAEILAVVGEACEATFRLAPGFKERIFDNPGFSADITISASTLPHRGDSQTRLLLLTCAWSSDPCTSTCPQLF